MLKYLAGLLFVSSTAMAFEDDALFNRIKSDPEFVKEVQENPGKFGLDDSDLNRDLEESSELQEEIKKSPVEVLDRYELAHPSGKPEQWDDVSFINITGNCIGYCPGKDVPGPAPTPSPTPSPSPAPEPSPGPMPGRPSNEEC